MPVRVLGNHATVEESAFKIDRQIKFEQALCNMAVSGIERVFESLDKLVSVLFK